ncbi:protein serine/threonine phosphatase 2C [Atractiella rhizophila]|nr:protein serine/threonine phosphatase 2C [Atractiella rhizophila]
MLSRSLLSKRPVRFNSSSFASTAAVRLLPRASYASTSSPQASSDTSLKPKPKPTPSPLSSVSLFLGLTALSGVSYWIYTRYKAPQTMKNDKDLEEFFTISVPAKVNGKVVPVDRKVRMLGREEAEKKLREGEETWEVNRVGNRVRRWDTASVSSNSPIEDAYVSTLISRPPSTFSPGSSVQGDLCFWGIFDGHSGPHTSKLLSTRLVPFVAKELQQVFNGSPEYLDQFLRESGKGGDSSSSLNLLWSILKLGQSTPPLDVGQLALLDSSPSIVSQAMKNGFQKLDDEIRTKPLDYLKQYENRKELVIGSGREEEVLSALRPAFSGSCSLLAYLDSSKDLLHVAVSGDSRAVMGTWEPDAMDSKGRKGTWRLEVLSEDQTGRNEKEAIRMRSEHPASEAETVVRRGRVLGSLEPTRALGDCRYKWPLGVQERLVKTFSSILPDTTRGVPSFYRTPPYVTPVPEVVTVSVAAPPTPPGDDKEKESPFSFLSRRTPSQRDRRFVVLATDGLYDRLSNEEIVALVGGWLDGLKGVQTTASILERVTGPKEEGDKASLPHSGSGKEKKQRWVFQDEHLGTHLIRNALGGVDKEVRALLSIPPPVSRRYRDDITVTVILIGEDVRETKTAGPSELEGVKKVARTAKL